MLQKSAKFNVQYAAERVYHRTAHSTHNTRIYSNSRSLRRHDRIFIPSHAQGNCIILMYYHHWRHLTFTTDRRIEYSIFFFRSLFFWSLLLLLWCASTAIRNTMGWCLMTHKRLHTHKPYELASWSQIKYTAIFYENLMQTPRTDRRVGCYNVNCTTATPSLLYNFLNLDVAYADVFIAGKIQITKLLFALKWEQATVTRPRPQQKDWRCSCSTVHAQRNKTAAMKKRKEKNERTNESWDYYQSAPGAPDQRSTKVILESLRRGCAFSAWCVPYGWKTSFSPRLLYNIFIGPFVARNRVSHEIGILCK